MPVSDLPQRYNFNSGIGVLPQFQQPMIDPTDTGNPLNTDIGQMPSQQPVRQYAPPPSLPSGPFNSAGSGFNSSGSNQSAGGWNIDQYGNLVNSAVTTGQNYGRTIGNFIGGEAGRILPLPGSQLLGGFLGRQVGSLLGHGIGGIIGSIGNGLSSLFGGGDGPNSTPPSDTPPGMGSSSSTPSYGLAPSQNAPNSNVYNTGRFNNAPPFFTTLSQAQFPGSMIGPMGGGNSNPYTGQFFHPASGDSGTFASTQAFQNYVASKTQK